MTDKCYSCKISIVCKIFEATNKLNTMIHIRQNRARKRNVREEIFQSIAECCDLYEYCDHKKMDIR